MNTPGTVFFNLLGDVGSLVDEQHDFGLGFNRELGDFQKLVDAFQSGLGGLEAVLNRVLPLHDFTVDDLLVTVLQALFELGQEQAMAALVVHHALFSVGRTGARPHQVNVAVAFFVTCNVPALGVGSTRLTGTRIHHLLFRINFDLEEGRTTNGVETGHVRTLDGREVFAAHRERHMAVHAVHLLVGVGVSNNVGLGLMAVLAGLTDGGLGVVVLPIVAGHFVRIVAGHAAHTLFIVLGHHELRAFGTAGRAGRLRLDVEALFKLALSGRELVVAFDEVGALVAAFAVRLEAVGFSANQVAAGTVAFFAGNTARNRVLLQFLGVAESLEEFVLGLKVKLERVADFAVGSCGLEQQSLFVGRTVGGHTPLVRSRRTELAQFSREIRNNLLDFLGLFGGEPLCPTAGELVAAGNDRTGEVTQKTVTDVVGTTNQPLIDEAVLRTRRTDGHVNVFRHDAVRQNRSLRAINLLILDYGRYHFEQQKKAKEAKRKQHVVEVKSLRLSPIIDTHDFETKLRHATKWIEAGMKVKVDMRFRGRLITRVEVGKKIMNDFLEAMSEIAVVEKKPQLEGNTMSTVLAPKKK